MGFFDKLKKAFSFEPEKEENEAEKVADKAETETSDANAADPAEETSKSELVEKKAQPEPDQVKKLMKQMAKMILNNQLQKMFWKKKFMK